MKKWLLVIIGLSPSTLLAAGAGGVNITLNPKALLKSTNTWTAAQTFSSITVTNCGGCGGGGGSDNLGSHVATRTIDMAGLYAITNSSGMNVVNGSISVGTTIPQAFLHLSSDTQNSNSNPTYLKISTGTGDIFVASNSYVMVSTASLIVGATSQMRGVNLPLQVGPFPTRGLLATGVVALFSANDGTVNERIIFKTGTGEAQMGIGANGNAHFGTFSNTAIDIRINDQQNATWDTSGNYTVILGQIRPLSSAAGGVPGISQTSQTGTGINILAANAGSIDFLSNGTAGRRMMGGFRNNGIYIGGNIGADTSARSTLYVGSSSLANVGEVYVSSVPGLPDFTVSHTSGFMGVPFLIAPSSGNGFTGLSPSTYAFAVSSAVPFNGSIPLAPYTFSIDTRAHINSNGAPPILSACGTSTMGSKATDNSFTITAGGAPNSCVATFSQPFDSPPDCTATPQAGSLTATFGYSVTNVAVTLTETGMSGKYTVTCIGHD